jgi:hypothetical protein
MYIIPIITLKACKSNTLGAGGRNDLNNVCTCEKMNNKKKLKK